YFLNIDGQCHPVHPVPCPFDSTTTEPSTTTTTSTIPPTTTTTTTTTTTEEPTTTTTTTTTEEPTTTTTTTTTEKPTATTTTTEEPTTTTTTTEEPTTTTTTTTEEPTTTAEETTTTTTEPTAVPPPVPDELIECPQGSVLIDKECRKIVCSEGEYYDGRCLSPACPPGTVWRGRRCQEPGFVTTILEIGNVIHNEHEYKVTTENINRVVYETIPPYNPDLHKSSERPWVYPTYRTTTEQTPVDQPYPGLIPPPNCCLVKSPRICINYSPQWVCSNRERKLCDPRVCKTPFVYLKPPQVVETDNRKKVVLPPYPPLKACSTPECKESDVLDCSGCKDNLRDKCSVGCYKYYCPNGSCGFMNSEEYCELYPGGFGCNPNDGCIWDWCQKKCY
ncbi:hypothetical protein KR009_009255, partial [Drosophila setifemur]